MEPLLQVVSFNMGVSFIAQYHSQCFSKWFFMLRYFPIYRFKEVCSGLASKRESKSKGGESWGMHQEPLVNFQATTT
jgi:hypothetical protein